LISPRLEILEASVKPLAPGTYRVRLVVHNTGWLPTYITKKALERKVVRGVIAEIEPGDGVALETGKQREELGQLEGRAYKSSSLAGADPDTTDDRASIDWTVSAPHGGSVHLTARHERAGTVRLDLTLE